MARPPSKPDVEVHRVARSLQARGALTLENLRAGLGGGLGTDRLLRIMQEIGANSPPPVIDAPHRGLDKVVEHLHAAVHECREAMSRQQHEWEKVLGDLHHSSSEARQRVAQLEVALAAEGDARKAALARCGVLEAAVESADGRAAASCEHAASIARELARVRTALSESYREVSQIRRRLKRLESRSTKGEVREHPRRQGRRRKQRRKHPPPAPDR